MTYGELIPYNVSMKLSMISFGNPKTNLNVYKFVKAINEAQKFFEQERLKMFDKYGEDIPGSSERRIKSEYIPDFNRETKELLDMELEDAIPSPELTEDDFNDKNCCYPIDKNLWMNGAEIDAVLLLSNKLSKKEG